MMPLYLIVDGGWGEWGSWSSDCPTNCLQERKRKRTRTRTCSNPAPQGDGIGCEGKNIDLQNCGKKKLNCFCVVFCFSISVDKIFVD